MKTVEIVKNLLDVVGWLDFCPECGKTLYKENGEVVGHKETCKIAETKKAAEQYLKIMNGSTK